ncbi:MAG: MurR/RpiR family transcriptional regulator [Solobacterium sp.]|nr:MurR/RpiR family transcriptional regulator [Solobacterium sp.]
MTLIRQLQRKQGFTSSETVIADFILNNSEAVSDMGITELAEKTFTSNATVLRLIRKLGIGGYREFRIAYTRELERAQRENHEVDINNPFFSHASASVVMNNVGKIMQQAVRDCSDTIYPSAIDTVGRILAKAGTIYIMSDGDTQISCYAFENMMNKIGRQTTIPRRYGDSVVIARWSGPDEAALFVSYSGFGLSRMKKEAGIFRKNGTPVILISTLDKALGFDFSITLPDNEKTVGKAAGYYSQECVRYVLNSLYGFVYALDLERHESLKTEGDKLAHDI